jgi:hypothetical protein
MADSIGRDPQPVGDPLSTAAQLLKGLGCAYAALRHAAADPYVRGGYFFAIAFAAMWPTLGHANLLNDFRDAQYFTLFEEAARLSVAKFHQLPLWNPYYCGGISGIGTPSARFASPTFLLTLLFGTLRGDALIGMAMTIVGLEGSFRYMRDRGGGPLASMTAASVFALSGVFAHTTSLGWTNFLGFELVPWALFGLRRALNGSRRGIVVAALSIAWMIGFGGTYTGPLTFLAAAFEVVVMVSRRVRQPRRLPWVLLMGVPVVFLAAALSLVRLWPVAETLSASPRIIGEVGGLTGGHLWQSLFGDRASSFDRSDFLIGLPVLPIVVFGFSRMKSIPLTLGGLLWMWLALGYKVHASLFALLRSVPPYTMLRSPERFLVFVALMAAGLAALGIRRFEAMARKERGSLLFMILPFACHAFLLCDTALLISNARAAANGRTMSVPPPHLDRAFHQSRGNRWLAVDYTFMSRGSLSCFDDYNVAQSPVLRGDLTQEEYLLNPDAGTVQRLAWSPNRIDLHVELTKPARVFINQNWHPGWRSNMGTVVSDDGVLAVDLQAGSSDLTLRFLPRSAVGGIATFVLGLAAAALLWWRASLGHDCVQSIRDFLVTAALCLVPFAGTGLAFAFMKEPRRPPPALLTPAGEPMVVDAPSPDAKPVHSRWAEGVELEAAQIVVDPTNNSEGTFSTVELDWRVERKLPSGLGVFLHFDKPGTKFGSDHVLLSNVMPIEDAPLNKTLRDVSEIVVVPRGKTKATWNVYAGLWRARGDQTRLDVVDAGDTTENANRVLIGTIDVPAQ